MRRATIHNRHARCVQGLTYIPAQEIQAYINKAVDEKLLDQQVRDVDIGKANIAIGLVYRKKLDAPAPDSVAEHDQVSEVYHVIEGSGTLVLGPDIIDMKRRPQTDRAVRELNGPGNSGASIKENRRRCHHPGWHWALVHEH